MAVFSVISCASFVWESYLPDGSPLWMFNVEVVVSMGFAVNYAVFFYVAQKRLSFVLSTEALVDIVTVPPVLLQFFTGTFSFDATVGVLRFSRVMKFARVLRLLRIMRSVKVMSASVATNDAITNQLITFVSALLSLMVRSPQQSRRPVCRFVDDV